MLSSSSVQNFHNDKMRKKNYQKFKNCQIKNDISTVQKIENKNSGTVSKTEMNIEQSSNRCINLKNFSKLKVYHKHNNKSSYENSSNEMLTVATAGSQKKSIEAFPALVVTAKHNIDEVNLVKNEEKLRKIILEESTSALSKVHPKLRFEMQGPADVNINKVIKVSSKKASVQPQMNIKKKKRADPVIINFQDILTLNKIQKKRKQYNTHTTKVQKVRPKEFLSGNFLDSSNPKRNRGKHREIKKEKLSTFKMTIIKERILKQKMREIALDSNIENVCFNVINKIDFKSEIKIYLNKLNEKKIKNLENSNNKMREDIKVRSNNKEKQENLETKLDEKKEENSGNVSDVKGKEIPQVFSQGEIRFSSKFREYCDNIVTPDLNSAVTELIKELIKLQDKLFSRDPIKAKVKKRHVSGIREVRKYLTLKKVKMVIIAPNLEKLQMEGSVYDSINELKSMASSQNVIYGFALDRYKLGRCTKKNVPVSVFAVLNYEGIEDLYKKAVYKLQEAKKKFSEFTKPEKVVENEENTDDVNSQIISSLISAFRENLEVSKKTESQSD